MTTPEIPTAAKALLRQLEDWSVQTHAGVGPCEFGGLSEDTDGEGKRRRVIHVEDVDYFHIVARHVDGRGIAAIWIRRPGTTPAGKRKGWSLDMAWRGKRRDEFTPKQITATEMKAYVAPVLTLKLKEVA